MLTKAIIQEVLTPYSIRIRIPSVNKIEGVNGSTPNNELYIAAVCSLPKFIIDPRVGDIVVVGFEDNDMSNPIVLGYLSKSSGNMSIADIVCNDFEATGEIKLSKDTSIGEVTPINIESLKNQKENINDEFNIVKNSIDTIKSEIKGLSQKNSASMNELSGLIKSINESLNSLGVRIKDVEDSYTELNKKFSNYLEKYPTVLDTRSYGSDVSSVTSPYDGQIYFTIKDDATQ
jgi:archaellum component FlaC